MRKMYSKKQIEGMAKAVADTEIASVVDSDNEEFVDELLASLQNEDVEVKTIEQSEANHEFTTFAYSDKFTAIEGGYIGVKIVNNVLYVIITKRFSVNDSFTTGPLVSITLPNDVLAKLETIPNAFNSGTITSEVGSFQKTGQGVNPLLYKVMKLENGIEISSSTNMQLIEGNNVEISVRTFFILI